PTNPGLCGYTLAYGLAGLLAYDSAGNGCDLHPRCDWVPACLLDRVFELALEVPGRSCGCSAHRSSANGFGFLPVGGSWTTQPNRTLVASGDRPRVGFYFRGTCHRVGALQSSLRRAALGIFAFCN